MIRLLWKDFRQRRTWALLVVLSAVVPVLMGSGSTFIGQFRAFTPYVWLSAMLSFAMASSRKDIRDSRDFLHSRPVSFVQDTLAGALIGLGVITLAALAAAIAFALHHPGQYAAFVTFPRMALGVGYAMAVMGVGYTVGSAPFVVLSGRWGGVFVLGAVLAADILRRQALSSQGAPITIGWPEIVWLLAGSALVVLILRFGRSLEPGRRMATNLVAIGLVIIAAYRLNFVPVDVTPPNWHYKWSSISPDGNYAIVQYLNFAQQNPPALAQSYLVDLRAHRGVRILWPVGGIEYALGFCWTDSGVAYHYSHGRLYTVRMAAGYNTRLKTLRIDRGGIFRPSPDRRHAMVYSEDDGGSNRKLEIVDVVTLHQTIMPVMESPRRLWWQSNTEVGYIDERGKRHIVRVVQ